MPPMSRNPVEDGGAQKRRQHNEEDDDEKAGLPLVDLGASEKDYSVAGRGQRYAGLLSEEHSEEGAVEVMISEGKDRIRDLAKRFQETPPLSSRTSLRAREAAHRQPVDYVAIAIGDVATCRFRRVSSRPAGRSRPRLLGSVQAVVAVPKPA